MRDSENRRLAALATVCLILFLTFIDNTIVSVALADIQQTLHAGVSQLQWIINGYALVFAALMLTFGTLGDLFGRKKVMLAGAAVFCIGSVICAVATDANVLIAGRVVMGAGAAASEPGTLSMLRHIFPDRRARAQALGVWAAVSALALALGPAIGGALIGVADWHAVFWFNLVFGVVALVAAVIVLPENADPQGRRVDVPGSVLVAGALAAATLGVIQGESSGYDTWWIVVLLAASAVLAVAFLAWERRAPDPLLDLRFLRIPAFTGSNFVAFAVYFGTFSVFFFTALYLQVIHDYTGYRTALQFLPMTVAMIAAAAFTGRWVAAAGPRWPMALGCVASGVGLFLTDAALGEHVHFGQLAWRLVLVGVGFGVAIVPVTSAVLSAVPAERSGLAASATNTSREIGAVFGAAVLGALVNAELTSSLRSKLQELGIPANFQAIVINGVTNGAIQHAPTTDTAHQGLIDKVILAAYDAFYQGLHVALVLSGVLVLVAAVVAFVMVRQRGDSPSYAELA